jgi:prepilin-type N-terminal cleavage/methylation domain-containing protein
MKRQRFGFTLVELLVVMSLIAILATIAIAFFPNAASAAREARAAQALQSWLNIAKQRALRDGAPRGVRLWVKNPAWVNTITYNTGDLISFGGQVYQSTQNNNLNQVPSTTPAFWTQVALAADMLPLVVTDAEYIEQPPDFHGGLNTGVQSGVPLGANPARFNVLNTLAFTPTVDFTNGNLPARLLPLNQQPNANPDPNSKFWTVQPNDYVELYGNGLMHRVVQVGVHGTTDPSPNRTLNANYLVISPPLSYPVAAATTNYRILRAPRSMGDEPLKMPESTLIDLNTNTTYNNALPSIFNANAEGTGHVDILFAPNGSVISKGVATPNIHLWVRAPADDQPANEFRGNPTIVSIFVRTGVVGAYQADPVTLGNPYTLVR